MPIFHPFKVKYQVQKGEKLSWIRLSIGVPKGGNQTKTEVVQYYWYRKKHQTLLSPNLTPSVLDIIYVKVKTESLIHRTLALIILSWLKHLNISVLQEFFKNFQNFENVRFD